jgi:hypothetical protein
MREWEALDRRSRRTLLVSSSTLRRHRPVVDRWVAEGYGLTVVPHLQLMADRPSVHVWVEALCDTVEEMVRHGHVVRALRAAEDDDLDRVLQALAARQVSVPVESCRPEQEGRT